MQRRSAMVETVRMPISNGGSLWIAPHRKFRLALHFAFAFRAKSDRRVAETRSAAPGFKRRVKGPSRAVKGPTTVRLGSNDRTSDSPTAIHFLGGYPYRPAINVIPSRAGVCFVFAFRALSERFQSAFRALQSAFRALSVPFQGGGQKWAPTPSPERPTGVRRSSDGCPTIVRRPSNSREFPESEARSTRNPLCSSKYLYSRWCDSGLIISTPASSSSPSTCLSHITPNYFGFPHFQGASLLRLRFQSALRALSERFQSAFRALSVPFQGGGHKFPILVSMKTP